MQRPKPLNDFIFKKTFGEEETKGNLMALLNAILSPKDCDKLVTLEIVDNKELTRALIEDKTGIIDVRAKTSDGTQVEIEVQLTDQHNMDKRTMWYWGELFTDGIKRGDDYKSLPKVITINIVEFEYVNLPDRFHTCFHLREDEAKDYILTDVIEIHFIEMPKFRKLKNKNLQGDPLQRWLSFLDVNTSEEALEELMAMDDQIREAEKKIDFLASDAQAIALYKARERSLHERANMISSAIEKGMEKGREEGMEKGMEKGAIAKALKVAEGLLKMGLGNEQIALVTELSLEEIIKLRQKIAP